MQPVYSNGVSLHFNIIQEHTDVSVPPMHKLKNFSDGIKWNNVFANIQ